VEGLSLVLASVQARLDGARCVGDADYHAVARVIRNVWPDSMLPAVMQPALEQIKAVFDTIHTQESEDVCNAPTTACRLETYKRGLSFSGVPDCAKPVYPFDLVRAVARKKFSEIVVTYSRSCEVVTATTTNNYNLAPAAKIVGALTDFAFFDERYARLLFGNLYPKRI
jgi:hypothetical protein